jgi:spore coat protein U-like protein
VTRTLNFFRRYKAEGRAPILRWVAALAGLTWAGGCAAAVSCSLIITPINFAAVDPTGAASDAEGSVRIDCNVTAAPGPGTLGITIKLSPGNAGNYSGSRRLSFNTHSLNYQVYTAPARLPSQIWGDGTSSTLSVGTSISGLTNPGNAGSATATAFGRVFASQGIKYAGVYTDNLLVTIDF